MGASGSHNLEKTKGVDGNQVVFPFGDLPEELIVYILSFIPAKDLIVKLRRVCKAWKELIDSKSIWIAKCRRDNVSLPLAILQDESVSIDLRKICLRRPFNRNLLLNWNAEEGLKYWQVTEQGGDKFRVEGPPHGANTLLDITDCDVGKCWATSYGWCTKGQRLDLWKQGCSADVLDKLQPNIEVSDWIAARWDCATIYHLDVKLLAADKKTVIDKFHTERQEDQWLGKAWSKVQHVLTDYGPGVRYVHFVHRGKDRQYWAGHYGTKMAAPCVKVTFSTQKVIPKFD